MQPFCIHQRMPVLVLLTRRLDQPERRAVLAADSGEGAVVQSMMMGGVAVMVTSLLLLLWFFDNPYVGGAGGLKPTSMQDTLQLLQRQTSIVGAVDPPCDEEGTPR